MNTKITEIIKDDFGYPKEHPTFEEIHAKYIEKHEPIEARTLQKNLDQFSKEKIIYYVVTNNEKRYGLKEGNHSHFICSRCGKVKDVFLEEGAVNMIKEYANKKISTSAKIEKVNVSFEGPCFECS